MDSNPLCIQLIKANKEMLLEQIKHVKIEKLRLSVLEFLDMINFSDPKELFLCAKKIAEISVQALGLNSLDEAILHCSKFNLVFAGILESIKRNGTISSKSALSSNEWHRLLIVMEALRNCLHISLDFSSPKMNIQGSHASFQPSLSMVSYDSESQTALFRWKQPKNSTYFQFCVNGQIREKIRSTKPLGTLANLPKGVVDVCVRFQFTDGQWSNWSLTVKFENRHLANNECIKKAPKESVNRQEDVSASVSSSCRNCGRRISNCTGNGICKMCCTDVKRNNDLKGVCPAKNCTRQVSSACELGLCGDCCTGCAIHSRYAKTKELMICNSNGCTLEASFNCEKRMCGSCCLGCSVHRNRGQAVGKLCSNLECSLLATLKCVNARCDVCCPGCLVHRKIHLDSIDCSHDFGINCPHGVCPTCCRRCTEARSLPIQLERIHLEYDGTLRGNLELIDQSRPPII